MELLEQLQDFGLNEKEARVYLALLPMRKATAYMLSLKSGLKKSTTYMVLENLVNKGFILKIPDISKTFYIAKSPKDCLANARRRLNNAEDAIPELMAMHKEDDSKVSIAYFEGIDGIKELYTTLLRDMKKKNPVDRSYVGFNAHQKDTPEKLEKYWQELNEEFKDIELKRRIVTTEHESLKKYLDVETQKKYSVTLKALPEEIYSSNVSIEVYDSITQIVSHRYLQAIRIENPDIASVLKQIFEIVWKGTN
jgi:sugar-specific transcriptional regulator TrmB